MLGLYWVSIIEMSSSVLTMKPDMQSPREFWTMDIPSSWFAVDLMRWSVLPIAYTLRHGGNYVAESLRNWDFQGSLNGKEWVILRRYTSALL